MQNREMLNRDMIADLMSLADVGDAQEFRAAGVDDIVDADDELSAILADMQKEERTAALRRSAQQILAIGQAANRSIEESVNLLRQLRQRERIALAHIKNVNTARSYAKSSKNYLPLAAALGLIDSRQMAEKSELYIVPADFNPDEPEKKPASSRSNYTIYSW